ncbi:cytidine deaminase [candidate division WOR-3 bacterium]|nr:cytidine deaminase [candidate division WOR-3 bacterium]
MEEEMTKSTQARLLRAARQASTRAYAPFSKFKVGAAVLTTSGRIFSGCNVENNSYGLTVCAERVAIFKAVSAGQRDIRAVLVYVDTPKLTAPCGACLQVIGEFSEDPEVILSNGRSTKIYRLRQLLPHSFKL